MPVSIIATTTLLLSVPKLFHAACASIFCRPHRLTGLSGGPTAVGGELASQYGSYGGSRRGDVLQVVGGRTQHVRASLENPERLGDGDVRGQLDVLDVEVLESPQQPAADGPAKSITLALGGHPTEPDQELTRHK